MPQTATYEKIKWPHNKQCAVMLSFDLDGNTIWKNGNKFIKDGEKFIRSVSVGEYGPKRAIVRLLDMLDKHDLKTTFFIPAQVVLDYPHIAREIDQRGHEIGHHGFHHERYVDLTPEEQVEVLNKSQEVFLQTFSKKAVGYRTPSGDWSQETAKILYEQGFLYSSSMRGDDRPYRTIIDNVETDFIEMAPKWDLDDFVQLGYNLYPAEPSGQDRIAGIEQVFENFKQEFDGYYREGLCFVIQCHPQVIGSPGSLLMYERLIKHIKQHDVWFAQGHEIATWWKENY